MDDEYLNSMLWWWDNLTEAEQYEIIDRVYNKIRKEEECLAK